MCLSNVNPAFSNIARVPLWRNDDDVLLPGSSWFGNDTTSPPPASAISVSAPSSASYATPERRWSRSTKKHVMRQGAGLVSPASYCLRW
jgi:hypothetical protein